MSKNRGKKGGQERPKKKPQKQPLDRTFGMKNKKGKVAQRTVPVTVSLDFHHFKMMVIIFLEKTPIP